MHPSISSARILADRGGRSAVSACIPTAIGVLPPPPPRIDSVIVLAAPCVVIPCQPLGPSLAPAAAPEPTATPLALCIPRHIRRAPPVKRYPICARCRALQARRDPRPAAR
ncbi:hypothetical protein DFH09DRAFT_1319992 [Mycena vulgaris]|nr:hypothetical protein DFH09DRAFT_1319992 [Mycena vulgaris]